MNRLRDFFACLRGRVCLAVALGVASGCTSPSATSVRVALSAPATWGVSEVRIAMAGRERRIAMHDEIVVLLDDALAGSPHSLVVDGLRGDTKIATARVTVTPELHREVRVPVSLGRVACGAWCARGARECRGDGIVICEQREEDGCMAWSEPIACDHDAPACSFGRCAATCTDECARGEHRCDGGGAIRECGQGDTDSCLEWLPPAPCSDGQVCSAYACAAQCHDGCTRDAVKCSGTGRVTCGDLDGDGCLEWSPEVPCATGESCAMGRCAPASACIDECTVNTCDATNTYKQCGNFDLDSCTELSAGEACVPRPGSCDEVHCDPSRGCVRVEHECPDAGTHFDAALAPLDANGTLPDAGSTLPDAGSTLPDAGSTLPDAGSTLPDAGSSPRDAGSPPSDAGPCPIEGAPCTPPAPSSACFARTGFCHARVCLNDFANGASCADGDACTGDDVCAMGACRGTPMTCTTPPPRECVGTILRSYDGAGACTVTGCVYPRTDTPCPERCESARCVLTPGWRPTPISTIGAPSARAGHVAVWTGSEMIVWGGRAPGSYFGDGARYDPATDHWSPMSTVNAPTAREDHSAVWTGTEMIVWGGSTVGDMRPGDGKRYNPRTDSWSPMSTTGAPSAREGQIAVWTGTEMLVWAGSTSASNDTDTAGARYNPTTDAWSPLSGSGTPSARAYHAAVWTGSQMLVWGGWLPATSYDDGYRFDPRINAWSAISRVGAPSPRSDATAIWTGDRMVIWGGNVTTGPGANDGGRYDLASDSWAPLPADSVTPQGRLDHSAVWTGTEMIIWGGDTASNVLNDGWRWRP